MKRISVIAVMAMVLVLAVASGVFAAQQANFNGSANGFVDFEATAKSFNADGTTQYPDEIYLPNETDPSQYRIHSNYAATTDACASCHATHTAVGASLLQWGTVYDTCMACHDGTITSTYNVKGGEIGSSGTTTFGGMFGDGTEASASMHNVNGAVTIYSAPGGFGVTGGATPANLDAYGKQASWDVEFGCQSCHSPHGQGGNARLLNPDANGVGWAEYNKAGGSKGIAVTDADADGKYTTDYNADGVVDTWILGYPYAKVTKLYDGGVEIPVANYTISNADGTTKITFSVAPAGTVTADFVPAMRVQMSITDYLQGTENVTHVAGLNQFCGACHTDYNTQKATNSGSKLTGTYTEAYRHQVGMNASYFPLTGTTMKVESGKATCETCHFAHGANADLWQATGVAAADAVEIAGSSALKRLPNMGTCETCHQKGKGNDGYAANGGATVAGTAGTANPSNPVGATYIGSAACGTCHEDKHSGWETTLHSKMVGQGAGTVLSGAKVDDNTWLGGTALVRNQDGAAFAPKDVVLTLGTKWKQRYLVATTEANGQYAFLSKQYNVKEGTWDNYTNKATYDLYCLGCHSTGYKVTGQNEDSASPTFEQDLSATWTEFNVGCEACHGPGSNHKASPNAFNIWNPSKQSAAEVNRACGYCHNRGESETHKTYKGATLVGREDIPAPLGETHEPWEDWTTYGAVVPGIVGAQYSDYSSATPTLSQGPIVDLRDMFYAPNGDGLYDDKKHHQQYQSFSQTGAGHNTTMSCVSCHSSHSRNSQKEQLKQLGADMCSSCHGTTYSITQNMPMTGKTIQNVYVRTHSFSASPTAQPVGAVEPVNP